MYKHPIQNHNHYILFDQLSNSPISPNQNFIDLPDFNSISSILNELKNSIQHSSACVFDDLQKAFYLCSNRNVRNLRNLRTLFENNVGLLKSLIPKIIDLALDLPNRIKKNIPLLKQGSTDSISLSDDQCASILANAFFCTFPNRSYQNNPKKMPFINFDCLYNDTYSLVKLEKLKCILNYFECITSKKSDTKRIITYSRVYNTEEKLNNLEKFLKENKLNFAVPKIYPEGTIEDHKLALQVDFANKYIGGGVLNAGCVQEEIRFVLCPELLVSLLFMECMDNNECILIRGAKRFSNYKGYASTFQWAGHYEDQTNTEVLKINETDYERILTDVVAIDALHYRDRRTQFKKECILREIVKSYTGFTACMNSNDPEIVATGNWGCGAFNGNVELKFLIQLISATLANKEMAYYTFNNNETSNKLFQLIEILKKDFNTIDRIYNEIENFISLISNGKIKDQSIVNYFKR